jgi:hypothetical protein
MMLVGRMRGVSRTGAFYLTPTSTVSVSIAVFVVVLKLFGSIRVFVLLTQPRFVLTGSLVSRVVIVIDCSG